MIFEAIKIVGAAVTQILLLGMIGYFLKKKNILTDSGLDALSRLVIDITLPLLIFCRLVEEFSFSLYPQWWIFPLASVVVTICGLIVGFIFSGFISDTQKKLQFLSLIAFQNSGYLPLPILAALLPADKSGVMLIYLFLFLIGFNLVMWPLGGYILCRSCDKKFEIKSLFSGPVIASSLGLVIVFLGLNKFMPGLLLRPLRLVGECTLPLAMFVVGADLAKIKLEHVDKKAMFFLVLAKLIILPALGLFLIFKLNFEPLFGLLILLQLAVPPATSLSVILRHYKKEDLLVSQGILIGHLLSIVSIPLFLSLYFARVMIQ